MPTLTLNSTQLALVNETDTNIDTSYLGGLNDLLNTKMEGYDTLDAAVQPKVRIPFKNAVAAMLVAIGTPTWNNLTLGVGWAATNIVTFHTPSYALTGWNTLKLRGHLTPSAGAGTTFANLPVGARPTKTLTMTIPGGLTNVSAAILTITATGDMSVSVSTPTIDYSLDGLEIDLT